jgi:outer membrane receptor for ferrienterochelin and colicins
MGGVINVITKDARFAPRLSLGAYATSNGETSANLAAARTFGGAATLVSVSGSHNDRFVDRNGDDFSDLPLVSRISVFNKWSPAEASEEPMQFSARYYHETRFGGTSEWTSADRGSSSVYGESIHTSRAELLGTYTIEAGGSPLRVDAAFNWHDQNSYYGDQPYMATQTTTFVQGAWLPGFGRSSLALGATLRYQSYRDSATFHQTRDENLTPGLFAQNELALGSGVTLLAGLRVDRHPVHGTIPSPRLALKWDAGRHTTLRVNAATGFRVVSLFTEDHAALTGARDVRIEGKLDPERSRNLVVSLNRTFDIGGVPDALTLDLDAYLTRFTNRIVPDYDTDPELIVYRNLRGMAETRGVELALGYATALEPLSANLGITLQDVYQVNDGVRSDIAFATHFQGVFTLGYKFPRARLALDWTGRVLGPMQLPRFDGLPSRSPWLTEQHVQGTWSLRSGVNVYGAVKNIFDYVQANPIIDPWHPFGSDFDTARVYGPIQGRRVLLGMRYALGQ